MLMSENISEISPALVKLQGMLPVVKKDTQAFKYKYATIAAVWEAIRGCMLECGLSVIQDTASTPQGVAVTTRIIHTSAQWIEFGPLLVPMGKMDAHSTGSAITYGRRYSLCAALGIVTDDDDDGQAAQAAGAARKVIPSVDPVLWKKKWEAQFSSDLLQSYLEARAKHFRHSEEHTINELAQDEALFVKNLEVWTSQQQKKEE